MNEELFGFITGLSDTEALAMNTFYPEEEAEHIEEESESLSPDATQGIRDREHNKPTGTMAIEQIMSRFRI